MQGCEIDECVGEPEKQVVVVVEASMQCILDVELTKIVLRGVACAVDVTNLMIIAPKSGGEFIRIHDAMHVPLGSWRAKSS